MRKALNENPKVQIAVLGVLLLVVGFIFLSRSGGEDTAAQDAAAVAAPPGVSSDGAVSSATTGSTAPAASPAPGAPAAATTPAAPAAPATPPAGSVSAQALKPGPGLPAPVVAAWRAGEAIVLLVAKRNATDDRLVRGSVRSLESRSDVAVFVVRADKIARYSRIAQAVGVNRVPALIVVRPRSVSDGVPQAHVSYGFRDSESVVQAVEDALYTGRDDVPYHPG